MKSTWKTSVPSIHIHLYDDRVLRRGPKTVRGMLGRSCQPRKCPGQWSRRFSCKNMATFLPTKHALCTRGARPGNKWWKGCCPTSRFYGGRGANGGSRPSRMFTPEHSPRIPGNSVVQVAFKGKDGHVELTESYSLAFRDDVGLLTVAVSILWVNCWRVRCSLSPRFCRLVPSFNFYPGIGSDAN